MFSLAIPVNYEDTDAGGVVYYANYLGYMERARNACLRELGFPLNRLILNYQTIFVVAEANLKYLKPARLDDIIDVTMEITDLRAVSLRFSQKVICQGEVLVDAKLKLATLNSDTFLPCKIPVDLRQCLALHHIEYARQ